VTTAHLSASDIERLVIGEPLPAPSELHLASCATCATAVTREARLETALYELARHAAREREPADRIEGDGSRSASVRAPRHRARHATVAAGLAVAFAAAVTYILLPTEAEPKTGQAAQAISTVDMRDASADDLRPPGVAPSLYPSSVRRSGSDVMSPAALPPLGPEDVERVVAARHSDIDDCTTLSAVASERMRVSIAIDSGGTVAEAAIAPAAMTATARGEFTSCVVRRLKAWRFPRSSDGGTFGFDLVVSAPKVLP
jgi:hypothetical protein